MSQHGEITYSDTRWLTLGLVAALGSFLFLSEVGLWAALHEMDLYRAGLDRGEIVRGDLVAMENRRALIGGLLLLSFTISAVLMIRWTYVSNRNARALRAEGMHHGPVAAAAWYVVPGFHAWKPLEVMRELFRASHPDHVERWRRAPVPHLLTLWWTLWLVYQFTTGLNLLADVWATSVPQLYVAAWGSVVTGVIGPPLALAASIVVWRLHALQRARHRVTAPLRVRQPWPTRATDAGEPA